MLCGNGGPERNSGQVGVLVKGSSAWRSVARQTRNEDGENRHCVANLAFAGAVLKPVPLVEMNARKLNPRTTLG